LSIFRDVERGHDANRMRAWLLPSTFSLLISACASSALQPPEAGALESAERMELLSLHPYPHAAAASAAAGGDFHGYPILGRAVVSAATDREALAELVDRAARENPGHMAKCFNPRHGLRVSTRERSPQTDAAVQQATALGCGCRAWGTEGNLGFPLHDDAREATARRRSLRTASDGNAPRRMRSYDDVRARDANPW
jgi:hypothetical protein